MTRRRPARCAAWALALATSAAAAEPPALPGLSCQVLQQEPGTVLRLRVRFENQGTTPVELPPAPQLVLYADADANARLDAAARMDRVQRTPLLVPAQGKAEALFAVAAADLAAGSCSGAGPSAAAMYFYRFSQRPQSRCILQGVDARALACPAQGDAAAPTRP